MKNFCLVVVVFFFFQLQAQSRTYNSFKDCKNDSKNCDKLIINNDQQLRVLTATMLKGLEHLKHIDLSRNAINSIEDGTFSSTSQPLLELINLDYNQIEHCNFYSFDFPKSVAISVKRNSLDCCLHYALIQSGVFRNGNMFEFDCNLVHIKNVVSVSSDFIAATKVLTEGGNMKNDGTCEYCEGRPDYYFEENTCKQCKPQEGCEKTSDSNECITDGDRKYSLKCAACDREKEYVITSDGQCKKCEIHTYYYNEKCYTCDTDETRYIDLKTSECKKCKPQSDQFCLESAEACAIDENSNKMEHKKCRTCSEGHGLNKQSVCVNCLDSKQYLENGRCFDCADDPGRFLNSEGHCEKCIKQAQCDEKTDKCSNIDNYLVCKKCKDGFSVNDSGLCKGCQENEYYSDGQCLPCGTSLGKAIDKNGKCVDCIKQELCNFFDTSTSCAAKEYIASFEIPVLECNSHCSKGYLEENSKICKICKTNQYLDGTICKECLGAPDHSMIINENGNLECRKCISQDYCAQNGPSCLLHGTVEKPHTLDQLLLECDQCNRAYTNQYKLCIPCQKGEYIVNNECENCAKNPLMYIDTDGNCEKCPRQDFCQTDGDTCIMSNETNHLLDCKICNKQLSKARNKYGICDDCPGDQYFEDGFCYPCFNSNNKYLDENNLCVGKAVEQSKVPIYVGVTCGALMLLGICLGIGFFIQRRNSQKLEKMVERELLNGMTPEEFLMGDTNFDMQTDEEYAAFISQNISIREAGRRQTLERNNKQNELRRQTVVYEDSSNFAPTTMHLTEEDDVTYKDDVIYTDVVPGVRINPNVNDQMASESTILHNRVTPDSNHDEVVKIDDYEESNTTLGYGEEDYSTLLNDASENSIPPSENSFRTRSSLKEL